MCLLLSSYVLCCSAATFCALCWLADLADGVFGQILVMKPLRTEAVKIWRRRLVPVSATPARNRTVEAYRRLLQLFLDSRQAGAARAASKIGPKQLGSTLRDSKLYLQ